MTGEGTDPLLAGIEAGDRQALARGITLIESQRPQDVARSQELLAAARGGDAMRIGITGVPGVGKSTFIEAFGSMLTAEGHRIAVLAIDPSSRISSGSIMGDKTRMETLSQRLEAFIRPSPAGRTLGGVTRHVLAHADLPVLMAH